MPLKEINRHFKPGLRLATVASFVPASTVVADIGTDHAYLPLHLVTAKNCPRVIAVENSEHNCAQARNVISFHKLDHKVEVRCGDGLNPLKESDGVEVVVIAGLGGKTICRLLGNAGKKLDLYKRLVLQPMGDAPLLRRCLLAHGFALAAERLAKEKGHFYEIISAEKGFMSVDDPFLLELGPGILSANDPLLEPWLRQKIQRCELILKNLGRSDAEVKRKKRLYFANRYQKLKDVLSDVLCGKRPDRYF